MLCVCPSGSSKDSVRQHDIQYIHSFAISINCRQIAALQDYRALAEATLASDPIPDDWRIHLIECPCPCWASESFTGLVFKPTSMEPERRSLRNADSVFRDKSGHQCAGRETASINHDLLARIADCREHEKVFP